MGYTSVFDTMLTGSLYGRWPHTGVWACLLSRVSREGVIDEHPTALAAAIGLPLDELKRCIDDFMQPDPESRSQIEEGRRLLLLDPNRSWGWKVVNHSKYKEKGRKKAYDDERSASGADAARKRAERESNGEVPTCPATSREVPLSPHRTSPNKRASRVPEDFSPDLAYAKTQLPDIDAEREAQKFRDWEFKTPRKDWAAAWRTWIGNCRDRGTYAKVNGSGLPAGKWT